MGTVKVLKQKFRNKLKMTEKNQENAAVFVFGSFLALKKPTNSNSL